MSKGSTAVGSKGSVTVGLDIGDKYSEVCLIGEQAQVLEEARVPTTIDALKRKFEALAPSLVAFEVGTHSPWISRLLESLGHQCVIANSSALHRKSRKKSDKIDALKLAKWARADPELLSPVSHRSEDMQRDISLLYSRRSLVEARSKLINRSRGLVKAFGYRLPKCDARTFHKKVKRSVPEMLKPAIAPLLKSIEALSDEIHALDKEVDYLADVKYGDNTGAMRQIKGVGPLTSLAYVLVIRDPRRFPNSRAVGAYLGLAPPQDQSGETSKERRISKAGNKYLRQLLVGSAHYLAGPFGADSSLRRWGLSKAQGGKLAKKRAVVGLARKLSVVMHRLWLTGEVYEPLRGQPAGDHDTPPPLEDHAGHQPTSKKPRNSKPKNHRSSTAKEVKKASRQVAS